MKTFGKLYYQKRILKNIKKYKALTMDTPEVLKFGYDEIKLWGANQALIVDHFFVGEQHITTFVASSWLKFFQVIGSRIQELESVTYLGQNLGPDLSPQIAERARQEMIAMLKEKLRVWMQDCKHPELKTLPKKNLQTLEDLNGLFTKDKINGLEQTSTEKKTVEAA